MKTRMLDKDMAAFLHMLEQHAGERHAIIIQNYPDPDAISSAFAHKVMAKKYNITCDILYNGVVSHQENKALISLLDIELIRYTEATPLDVYDHTVFIDNQGVTSSLTKLFAKANITPLIIMDHHEHQGVISAELEIIAKTGATATLYTQLIQNGAIEFKKTDGLSKAIATALMHGIRSDTITFLNGHKEDYQAATFLSEYYDEEALLTITNQSRSRTVMNIVQKALENRVINNGFSLSGIGYLRLEDRDSIPQAADFLLTEEDVHTTLVFGIVIEEKEQEILTGSFRTSKLTMDTDQFLKNVFGQNTAGEFYGGGRKQAGAFEIPIGFLSGELDPSFSQNKWELYNSMVRQRIFKQIGVENQT